MFEGEFWFECDNKIAKILGQILKNKLQGQGRLIL